MDIPTILSLLSFAVQQEPKVEQAIRNVLTKPNPTPDDWAAERANWQTPYEQLVPNSQLPQPTSTPTQSPS